MPSLQELESAFIAADDAGNHDDAQAFATEIKRMRTGFDFSKGLTAENIAQADASRMAMAPPDPPSMAGSFVREAARSLGPGIAGMATGAASGAAAGAAGLNPFTIAAGSLIGGVGGFMAARKVSDIAADAVAPESFMGTKSAQQDMQVNPWSTMIGGAIGGGGAPGPLRGITAIPKLITSSGRQIVAEGMREGATVAAKQAAADIIEPIVSGGMGAGLGLIHGDTPGGIAEQAALGLAFNRGWHNVPKGMLPVAEAPAPTNVQPMVNDGVTIVQPEQRPMMQPPQEVVNPPPVASESLTFDGGPEVRGPVVQGPIVEGPVVRGPIVDGPRGPVVGETPPREAWQGPPPIEGPIVRGPQIDSPTMDGPIGPIVESPRVGSEFPAVEQPQPLQGPTVVAPEKPLIAGPSVDAPTGPEVLGPAEIKVGEDSPKQAEEVSTPPAEPALPPTPGTPEQKQLAARTRVSKLKEEIGGLGQQIMEQKTRIDSLKKDGRPQVTITKAENALAKLQETQRARQTDLAGARSEVPRRIVQVSDAARAIVRGVSDNLAVFPGLNSIKEAGTRIKMPHPILAVIKAKLESKTPLSQKENNFLADNGSRGRAEYDGYIKVSDIDAMPGTPQGREAAKDLLRSIYARHDDATASAPDTAVKGKGADELWSELRSELEDIAKGKSRSHQEAADEYYAKEEEKFLAKQNDEKLAADSEARDAIQADEAITRRQAAEYADRNAPAPDNADDMPSWMKTPNSEKAQDPVVPVKEEPQTAKESLTLKAHESDAEIKAESDAAKKKAEIAKRQAAPLRGSAGDLTPDIFGEGDTPLFNERRDTPSKPASDSLRAHRDKVDAWIKGEKKSGRLNSMPVDILGAQAYKAALDVMIAARDAGKSIGHAVRETIEWIKQQGKKLTRDEEISIKKELIALAQENDRFKGQRDAKLMVEMPKIAQDMQAHGRIPTLPDLVNELAKRFPDQAAYIRKNGAEIHADMMFARDTRLSRKTTSQKEWGEWSDSVSDGARKIAEYVIKGTKGTDLKQLLTSFHATYMTGIGNKMRHLAEGNITGKESKAFGAFVEDLVGLAKGKDGVHRVSTDLEMDHDVTRFANRIDAIRADLAPTLDALPSRERKAFMDRIGDHITDPSRDGELANQPELKKAVDAYVKIREYLLKHMRDAGVEVGDAGSRTMHRVLDRPAILANPKEFVAQAANAYKAKWRQEVVALNREAATLNPVKDKARLAAIKREIAEIGQRDAIDSAEKYLTNIGADEIGITSDGNDLMSENRGNPSTMKSREFGPEADQLLGKFYLRNPDEILRTEIAKAVRAAGIAHTFSGPALDAQGNPLPTGEIDPMGKWKQLRKNLIDEGNADMVPLAATLLKEHFNLGGKENPVLRKALEIAHTHGQLAFLAKATLSSMGEPALIGTRTGKLSDVGRAYVSTVKGMYRELRGATPDEARLIANAIGGASDGINSILAANRFLDPNSMVGKSGELVAALHAKTWLNALTQATHAAAIDLGHGFIKTNLQLREANGKFKTIAGKQLNELGIQTKDVPAMLKFVDGLEKAPDKVKFITADTPEAKMYRDALHLFKVSGASLHSTRGTRPQYANSIGSMFYAFKSFLFAFQDQVLSRHYRLMKSAAKGEVTVDGAPEKLSGAERAKMIHETMQAVAVIAASQYAVQIVRESMFSDPARRIDDRKTDDEKLKDRIMSIATRANIFGGYDTIYNMYTGARYGADPATTLLGPSLGLLSSVVGQSVGLVNGDKNSPNTNTAERKFVRKVYGLGVQPLINAAAATMPGYTIPSTLIQAANHPGAREAAIKAIAGGPMKQGASKKKGPMRF